jgi:hypothetical protein
MGPILYNNLIAYACMAGYTQDVLGGLQRLVTSLALAFKIRVRRKTLKDTPGPCSGAEITWAKRLASTDPQHVRQTCQEQHGCNGAKNR